jgi:hypothetical protein
LDDASRADAIDAGRTGQFQTCLEETVDQIIILRDGIGLIPAEMIFLDDLLHGQDYIFHIPAIFCNLRTGFRTIEDFEVRDYVHIPIHFIPKQQSIFLSLLVNMNCVVIFHPLNNLIMF